MKWTSKGKKKKYGLKRFFKGFVYAGNGIITAIKTEQNLLFDLICGIIAIILGFILHLTTLEFTIVLLAISLVISMELINTAIEYVVDMAMPEIHPLAKASKDVASGAVLVSAIISLIIGIIIYIPKVIELL